MPSAPTTSLDLTDPAVVADPYPHFARERSRHPVAWHEPSGSWFTFSHAAVSAVQRDRRLGRLWTDREPAARLEPFNLLHRNQMMENEPPEHTRLRRPVASAFSRGHVERLRPRVRELATELLAEVDATDGAVQLAVRAVDASYAGFSAEDAGAAAVRVASKAKGLTVHNSFVSSVGWVKPGEKYPSTITVANPTKGALEGGRVTVRAPKGTTFKKSSGPGKHRTSARTITWKVPKVRAGRTVRLVVESKAASVRTLPTIVWRDLSTKATLKASGRTSTSTSHGPKVIPPAERFETARYGDRPFPVVPVQYTDRAYTADHTGEQLEAMRRNIWDVVEHIDVLSEKTGRDLHLGLEPEPLCYLETTGEMIRFYRQLRDDRPGDDRLSRRLGINYDACHLAVEFEEAADALGSLIAEGVRISKLHFSSALKVCPNAETLDGLAGFAEDIYFHQVVANGGDGSLTRYRDLPDALAAAARGETSGDTEWRIHFHVPLHCPPTALFDTTADQLQRVIETLAANPAICSHIEMETYTWEVLPGELKQRDVVDQLAGEYEWTLAKLAEQGIPPAD